MTREEYLKQLIIEDSGTLKDFAKKINMPYTTLYSISRNVGGASIDNILKICKVLGISADDLAEMEGVEDTPKGYYTNNETSKYAEMLRTRPNARLLFSAAKDISKEDMEKAVEYIEFLKSKNK
uniref:Helix-turn-helix domain protein n=1 Tax=Myoviridae sp. ctuAx8 TaxID=2825199 RepID=A0A8S5PZT3_9CAUD|nr:MAG TPA: helix-turn-helix domain protein [Myoviridae sp. ctuAx8]